MNVNYLQYSKIGKVMRHIAAQKDEQVRVDPESMFRERAQKLVDRWHEILSPSGAVSASAGGSTGRTLKKDEGASSSSPVGAPAANGSANGTAHKERPPMVMTETQELVVGAKGLDLNGDVAMDTDSAAGQNGHTFF
jgi:hypothetical protein